MFPERSSEKKPLLSNIDLNSNYQHFEPQGSRYLVIILLIALNTLIMYDRGSVTGMLSAVQSFYSLDDTSGGFIQTIYTVVFVLALMCFFRIGDHFDKKVMILGSAVFWFTVVLLSSFIPREGFPIFLALRAATAVGHAATKTLVPVICAEYFTGKPRAYALMAFFVAGTLGGVFTIIPGSIIITNNIDWQWGLRIVPFFGLSVIILLYYLMEPNEKRLAGEKLKTSQQSDFMYDLGQILQCKTFIFLAGASLFNDVAIRAVQFWAPTLMLYAMESTNYDPAVYFGMNYATIVSSNLVIGAFVAVFGTFLSVYIAQRIRTGFLCMNQSQRGPLVYVALSHLIAQPIQLLGLYFINKNIFLSVLSSLTASLFSLALDTVVTESILNTCEPQRHAAMNAAFTVLASVAGDGISPLLLGMLSDSMRVNDSDVVGRFVALRGALMYGAVAPVIASVLYLIASIFYPADAERVAIERRNSHLENDNEDEDGYGTIRRYTRTMTISSAC